MVRVKVELSNSFEFGKGLRQGNALLSMLFNLALKNVIRRILQRQTMKVNGNNILLACTDDITTIRSRMPQTMYQT